MYSTRFSLYLSLALAALFSLSHAMYELDIRQDDDGLGDLSTVISEVISAAPTTLPVINADTSTTTTSSSSSSSSSDPGSKISPTFIIPISNVTTTTSSSTSTSTTSTSSFSSSSSSTDSTSSSVSQSVTRIPGTTVFVTETSGGSTFVSSSVSYTTSTASAALATSSDGSSSSQSNIDAEKPVIIGVTVGIGGAIILAGLAFVAWRLWGRRAPRMDEDEILMAGSNAHGEKLTGSSGSQYKSNLEQYHAHSGTNF